MTAKSLKTQASNFSSERNAPQRFRFSACRPVLLLAALATLSAPLCHAASGPKAAPRAAHVDRDFGKVPLSFEKNQGQADAGVQFLSRGQGYALFLTPGEAVLELQKPGAAAPHANPLSAAAPRTATLGMKLLGGNVKAAVSGEDLLPGTVNYFVGSDQSKWKTALPTYQRVNYKAVYPGVDLVYYGNQRELEYDFIVAPGADAAKIALRFTGATPVIDKAGDLVLPVQGEDARFHKPVIYQMDGDRKISVEGRYQIADNKVGFALGAYDHSKPLVIDPVLSYLTYLGGTANDTITGMTVDSAGSVYVIGNTSSTDFPVKGAYQSTNPETLNPTYPLAIFVSKFNATGTALVYSTYLGASEYTYSAGIAVDTGGNAYVTGYTSYGDYPVTAGAYQTICGANNYVPQGSSTGVRINGCGGAGQGQSAGVLTKLNPAGSAMVYSTYLSGGNGTQITAVAVNAAGEAWVTGVSNAVCPGPYNANGTGYQAYFCVATTANASESGNNSGANADTYGIVVKFNAQGNGLLYSTVVGNHNSVGHYVSGLHATGIALDTAGNAYVTGYMDANFFITTTTGAFETSRVANSLPAFISKYNPAGTAATSQAYSTYLTGTTASNDIATGIAVDGSGNAVVTGYTNSCTFPTTSGAFSTAPGGYISQNICSGGFLSKLNAAGSGLVWSTYTGNNGANGRNNDDNDAVAIGPDGSVYVAGDEQGVVLSPTVNPVMVQSESHFAYIKQFKADGSAVVFSSAIGGTTDATSIPTSIFVDATNNIYLAGYTNSATYPTTPGAFQPHTASPGGGYINDGFVVKIAPTATTTTALTLPTGVVGGQSAKFTAKVTGQTGSTGTPTGTVTFLSGATTLGTGTLDGTGTASYTATSLNATTYSVTASYAGDTAFSASVSAAQNLVVAPATATVALTAPATALVGASVTLSVAVTGTPGTPTGSVTFKDGTTTLSTATLASGTASFSTSSLAAGAHTITVSYSGDSIFGAATSPASTVTINVAPAITFAAQPSSLTIVHGSSGTIVITGTPVGGYTGTVTFACGTLPTGASCTFARSSLTFTANNTAASTTLTFSTVTTVAALESLPRFTTITPVFAALMLLPLGFFSRRKLLRGGIVLSLLALVSMAALGGCSSGSKGPTSVTTPAGTYTVPVTVTAGTAVSTLNLSITVQ